MPAGKRTPDAKKNRRAFPRWQAPFEVRLKKGDTVAVGKPIEISEGGLSAHFDGCAFKPGEELELEYRLEGGQNWVKVRSAVRHSAADRIGVEFLNLKRADRLKIVDLLVAKA